MLLAVLHAIGRGHAAGEFGEELAEHALAAVAVDDALVVDEVRRSLRYRPLRHAGRNRLLFHVSQEAIEVRPLWHDAARGEAVAFGAAGLAAGGASWAKAVEESASRAEAAIANRVWSMRFPGRRRRLDSLAKFNGTIALKPVPRRRDAP